jgi:chromosome segregation ATPase
MVTFLKGRRRNDDAVVAVDSTGANITRTLEALVARAETAVEQLRSLIPVLDRSAELDVLRERCVAVEDQVAGFEKLRGQLAAAAEQAERIAETKNEMGQIEGRMESLDEKVERALKFREQLDEYLGEESPLGDLKESAEGLRTQLAELAENVNRMRGQHDDALTAHRHTTARLEAFSQDHQAAAGRLEDVERRVQAVSRALEPVDQAVTAVPDLQHRLAVLKSLADQVGQKTTMLEQQREAVDRAATQISQLTRLDRELDAWLRRQEEQMRRFGQIEAKIAEVHAAQVKIVSRSEELQQMSQQTEEAQVSARQSLTDLREQMRKSSESFELENRGLHAVSERIADLRNAVKECEARFAVLDAASQGASAVQAQVRSLGDEATDLSSTLARLAEEAARLAAMRQEVERFETVAGEMRQQMDRIHQVKPDVDEAVQHLVALKGTRELLADGMEQMRLAYEELTRVRETHGETQTWLSNTDTWTKKVQAEVKELSAMEPAVERIRAEVDQVKASMADIESRRGVVADVHQRLVDLGTQSSELKDRADTLRTRMEAAEARFVQLGRQADEAERVSASIAATNTSVTDAERRLDTVDGSVRGLEGRIQQLDEMEERIRILGQELEQRQGALDKATEHLNQASALRQQAAETAHRLEEVNQSVTATLKQAEERSGTLKRTTGDLETRANALKPVERQLDQFETLLGRWEAAQSEAARALEQTLARQAAVEAVEAQVRHVFGLAERAVADVQAIGSSRREIEETKAMLEETQEQFKSTEQALQGFETRKRQLERAEQRLARAEALALGIRSTVETLQAQRTVIDHAVESTGALSFQMKQAEALISALRRERTLACELKASIAAVLDEDETEEPREG